MRRFIFIVFVTTSIIAMHNTLPEKSWLTGVKRIGRQEIREAVNLIYNDLENAQSTINDNAAYIPDGQLTTINTLLSQWLNEAQSRLSDIDFNKNYYDKVKTNAFILKYYRYEKSIIQHVQAIETIVNNAQSQPNDEHELNQLFSNLTTDNPINDLITQLGSLSIDNQ